VDPARLLKDAEEHLPALVQRGSGVFEAWASLLGVPPPTPVL
jgi:hypothetical protein